MPALRSGNEERGERDVVRRIWTLGATLAVFALASLLFYWPALFGGKILLPLDNLWTMPPWIGPPGQISHNLLISDMILQNYPWKLILQQAFRQRELPLWNPYEMAGLPYLATGQTAVLYPLSWLFLVLGPLRAFGWYSALHQFLAAGLTYLFLRRLGVGRVGESLLQNQLPGIILEDHIADQQVMRNLPRRTDPRGHCPEVVQR